MSPANSSATALVPLQCPAGGPRPERITLIDISEVSPEQRFREMLLRKFPFRIGRADEGIRRHRPGFCDWRRLLTGPVDAIAENNDLSIHEPEPPYEVSRSHLEIGFTDGQPYVRDLGSSLGTHVNGRRIGGGRRIEAVFLGQRENTIVLGNSDSPWRFRLLLPGDDSRPRMLVADDEVHVRQMIAQLFAADFDVVQAADGAEALRLCMEAPPDIVMLDWMMPRIEGIKVCKTLKASLRTAQVPVILVTGMGMVKDRIMGIEAGADDYITKPFDLDEIQVRVRGVIARSRRARDRHWLTGIPAEAAFRDEVDALLNNAAADTPCDMLVVRVHGLGRWQHQKGPREADHLQQDIAQAVLELSMRYERALAGHLGAGRWALMLPHASRKEAERELRELLSEAIGDRPVKPDLSWHRARKADSYYDLIDGL